MPHAHLKYLHLGRHAFKMNLKHLPLISHHFIAHCSLLAEWMGNEIAIVGNEGKWQIVQIANFEICNTFSRV
jgi:hypothetical protein